jgi:hypothetical protein
MEKIKKCRKDLANSFTFRYVSTAFVLVTAFCLFLIYCGKVEKIEAIKITTGLLSATVIAYSALIGFRNNKRNNTITEYWNYINTYYKVIDGINENFKHQE